jgi:hypothetical protein
MALLVIGLLVRNEYVESLLARILVTIGVVAVLVPDLLPRGGEIPLVATFKGLIDLPGKAKLIPIAEIGRIVLVVMSLLAWTPGPATAAGKIFAWANILWLTAGSTLLGLIALSDIGAVLSHTPIAFTQWGMVAAMLAFIGYGFATVIGKQLE